MKAEKLQWDMTIKNYKELCEHLEMDVKGGKAKKLQLAELERYCKMMKVGHTFRIVEVYESALVKEESRGSKGFYTELLQLLIADYLLLANKPVQYVTTNAMLSNINMINQNYAYGYKNMKALAEYTQIDEQVVYDFYNTSSSNFRSTFQLALDKLVKKRAMFYSNVIMVAVQTGESTKIETMEANEHQIQEIIETEREVLLELEYEDMKQVRFNQARWDKFNRLVVKRYNEKTEEDGIILHYYYTAYKIIVNEKFIEKDHNTLMKTVLPLLERQQTRNEMNQIVCERLLENAKKRRNLIESTSNYKTQQARHSFTYVDDNIKLIELLIKKETNELLSRSLTKSLNKGKSNG